jgi:hypothetical protein
MSAEYAEKRNPRALAEAYATWGLEGEEAAGGDY